MYPEPIRLKVSILAEKHCCPGESGSSVQLPAHLLDNRAAKLSPNIVDMKLEFNQSYCNQNCFESLKLHLVPGLPTLIVQRPQDWISSDSKPCVAAQVDGSLFSPFTLFNLSDILLIYFFWIPASQW